MLEIAEGKYIVTISCENISLSTLSTQKYVSYEQLQEQIEIVNFIKNQKGYY